MSDACGANHEHRALPGERSSAPVTDGLVIVDKPAGMTSHDVVARIRRLTGTRRVRASRRTRATTSCEVIPAGLSTITSPSVTG